MSFNKNRRARKRRHTKRNRGLYYQNLKVLDVDNQFLFMHRRDKINWYLEKNLAEPVEYDDNGEVTTIRLTFKNKGTGVREHPYLRLEKRNQCVVCGSTDLSTLSLHHVVPWCFRRHLPIEYRNKNSFDCLLLCWDCHVKYEDEADKFKDSLNDIYLKGMLSKSAGYAKTLLNHGKNIPEFRKLELKKYILEEAKQKGWQYSSFEDLLMQLTKTTLSNWTETLVQQLIENDGVMDFIKLWRRHFISNTQPRYLAPEWQVDADYRGLPIDKLD